MELGQTIRGAYDAAFGGARNLSMTERAASAGFGLLMAAGGLRRSGVAGALMGLGGAALVARGLSGHCPVKARVAGGRAGKGPPPEVYSHGERHQTELEDTTRWVDREYAARHQSAIPEEYRPPGGHAAF